MVIKEIPFATTPVKIFRKTLIHHQGITHAEYCVLSFLGNDDPVAIAVVLDSLCMPILVIF